MSIFSANLYVVFNFPISDKCLPVLLKVQTSLIISREIMAGYRRRQCRYLQRGKDSYQGRFRIPGHCREQFRLYTGRWGIGLPRREGGIGGVFTRSAPTCYSQPRYVEIRRFATRRVLLNTFLCCCVMCILAECSPRKKLVLHIYINDDCRLRTIVSCHTILKLAVRCYFRSTLGTHVYAPY